MKPVVFALLFSLLQTVFTLTHQDVIYDYNGRQVYIHLHNHDRKELDTKGMSSNKIFRIPFNSKFDTGDTIANSTITSPTNELCKIVIANSTLLSFCPSSDETTLDVNKYSSDKDAWEPISLASQMSYLNDSNYLYTNTDPSGVYIFSGLLGRSVSTIMTRLDINSWNFTDATSRIQPAPFYKSTTLQINTNTQVLFGGISANNDLVSMMQIPVWQYNSWAERPCKIGTVEGLESRVNPLVLPVFSRDNPYFQNGNLTNFEVSSVLMIGGKTMDDRNAQPRIASLNVSSSLLSWEWKSLSTANGSNDTTSLYRSLDDIVAASTIYDTLIAIKVNETRKRDSSNDAHKYYIELFNATTSEPLDGVDYSHLQDIELVGSHTSKSTIIAISVIIPVLVIILVVILITWLYKRYKEKKEQELHDREVKEIVDFYQNQHKRNSQLTLTTSDSDYKSSDGSAFEYNIRVNNYQDDDNLSLSSWRKKRKQYLEERLMYKLNKPLRKTNNPLSRSLSVASNFMGTLSRKNSTQSSIATFVTAPSSVTEQQNKDSRITNSAGDDSLTSDNPFQSELYTIKSNTSDTNASLAEPPPAVPKHSTFFTLNRTNSNLHHIPEDSSINTFHSENLGFITLNQAYGSSPQHQYMKTIEKRMSYPVYASSLSSSSSYYESSFSSSASPSRSPSRSLIKSPPRSPGRSINTRTRPLSMVSIMPSINSVDSGADESFVNDTTIMETIGEAETGSIIERDNDNMEVQVLVGHKRRSKLRVVNPDDALEEEEVKSRCSSSGSAKVHSNFEVRQRVASREESIHEEIEDEKRGRGVNIEKH